MVEGFDFSPLFFFLILKFSHLSFGGSGWWEGLIHTGSSPLQLDPTLNHSASCYTLIKAWHNHDLISILIFEFIFGY